MNQNNQDSYKQFLKFFNYIKAVFPVLAVVIAVTYFAAMLSDYDGTIGHFAWGSPAFTASAAVSAVSAVLAFAGFLSANKKASFVKDPGENPVTIFGAVLCGVMSIACLIMSAADASHGMLSKFGVIYTVLIPFAGLTMVLSLSDKTKFSAVRRISAILGVLAVNVSMFADYFDFSLPLNSPVRNYVTVVKAAALLYLLSEAKFAFGVSSRRPILAQTVFVSGAAASITLGYCVGAILTSIFARIPSDPNPGIFELAFLAAIGIHAVGRLFTASSAVGAYVPTEEEKKKNAKNENENKDESKNDNQ